MTLDDLVRVLPRRQSQVLNALLSTLECDTWLTTMQMAAHIRAADGDLVQVHSVRQAIKTLKLRLAPSRWAILTKVGGGCRLITVRESA
jgi:hypothetical protein